MNVKQEDDKCKQVIIKNPKTHHNNHLCVSYSSRICTPMLNMMQLSPNVNIQMQVMVKRLGMVATSGENLANVNRLGDLFSAQ